MEPMSGFHPSLPADYRLQYFGNGLLAFFVFKSKFTFGFKTHRGDGAVFLFSTFCQDIITASWFNKLV
jgi:hypothetical protein